MGLLLLPMSRRATKRAAEFAAFAHKVALAYDEFEKLADAEPEGGKFITCTNCAVWLQENHFPQGIIQGYKWDENPKAVIGEIEGGHDFLVVQVAGETDIVDFWYRYMYDKHAPILIPKRDWHFMYGDVSKFEPVALKLSTFDEIVINSSGGKDSLAALWEVCRLADEQGVPRSRLTVSHQDLGESEWPGVTELVEEQCKFLGVGLLHVVRRKRKSGETDTFLAYAKRRGKWPSNKQRWCTSDFKRAPGAKVITAISADYVTPLRVLQVFGFRAQESTSRAKKEQFVLNKKLTTQKREVFDWLPIHRWTVKDVWDAIRANSLPYHRAYTLGMPRLSCVFCIFAPFAALVIAGKDNPELLDKYVEAEEEMGHTFKAKESLADVKKHIAQGLIPETVPDDYKL